MLKVLSVLALCGAVIGQTRNTNPCLGQTDATQFANDWTSCDSYFWCNLEVAYPAPPCADTFGFDDVTQTCTLDIMPCDACPATGSLAVSWKNCQSTIKQENLLKFFAGWYCWWHNLYSIYNMQRGNSFNWGTSCMQSRPKIQPRHRWF